MPQWFAMLLSMAIEAAVAAVAIAMLRWGRPARAAASAVLGTLLTHWLAWNSAPWLIEAIGAVPGFVAVEAAVTVVEAGVYRVLVPAPFARALVLSLAANGVSSATGVVLAALNLL